MGIFNNTRQSIEDMVESSTGVLRNVLNIFGEMEVEYDPKDKGVSLSDAVDSNNIDNDNSVFSAQSYGNMRRYLSHEELTKDTKLSVYRQMSEYPEINLALNTVTDEIISPDSKGVVANLDIVNKNHLNNINIKDNLIKEWDYVYNNLLKFDRTSWETTNNFLITGELFLEKVIDPNNPKKGLTKVKKLNPDNIYVNWNTDNEPDSYKVKLENHNESLTLNNMQITYINYGQFQLNGQTKERIALSYLEKIKKTWRQLQLLEEAVVIYRVVRAPEKRLFRIATGNMPKHKQDAYMQKVMRQYRQKKIYNTSTGEIDGQANISNMLEDYFFSQPETGQGSSVEELGGGCLPLDTKIPLLDGRVVTLETIIKEKEEGKNNWVYSCDPNTGEMVPGPITHANITNTNAKVMRITLDNGKTQTCTLNHKWPTWNKGTIEANKLEVGDSLIAFNKKYEPIGNKGNDYEMIFNHLTKKWEYTHRLVANYMKTKNKHNEYVFKESSNDKRVIHHYDIDRYNNEPSNLMFMCPKDHWLLHSEGFKEYSIIGNKKHLLLMKTDEDYKSNWFKSQKEGISNMSSETYNNMIKKQSESMKSYIKSLSEEDKNIRDNNSRDSFILGNIRFNELMNQDPKFREKVLMKRSESLSKVKNTEEYKKKQSKIQKNNFKSNEFRRKVFEPQTIKYSNSMLKFVIDLYKSGITKSKDIVSFLDSSKEFMDICMVENKSVKRFKNFRHHHLKSLLSNFNYKNFNDFKEKNKEFNHKIVKIEYLDETMTVANLTVDSQHEYHDFHTYALDIGVYTKNSNLGEITDVDYFLKKMYRALQIPESRRLDQTTYNAGQLNDVTHQELKFSKLTNRITYRISDMIMDVYKTHLQFKGLWKQYDLNEKDFNIVFNKDSHYAEFKEAQIMDMRMQNWSNAATYIGQVFSKEFAIKQFLKLSDQDIAENKELIKKEKEEGELDGFEGGF